MLVGPSDWCAPCTCVDAALCAERERTFVRVRFEGVGRDWDDQLQGLSSLNVGQRWPSVELLRRERELRLGAPPSLTLSDLLRRAPAGEVPEELAGQLLHFATLALLELPRVAVSVTLADLALPASGAPLAVPRLLVLEGHGFGAPELWQPPLPALVGERDQLKVLESLASALGLNLTWSSLDEALAWTAVYGPPEPAALSGWMRGVAPRALELLEELEDAAAMEASAEELQRLWRPLGLVDRDIVRERAGVGGDLALVLDGPEGRHRFVIVGDQLVLGRGRDCDISVGDPEVAERHLELARRDGLLWVRPLEGELWRDEDHRRPLGYGPITLGAPVHFGRYALSVERLDEATRRR